MGWNGDFIYQIEEFPIDKISVEALPADLAKQVKEYEARISRTVEKLKLLNPKILVPTHCTGWRGTYAIATAFPRAFVWNSVGNLYRFYSAHIHQ